MSPEKGLIEQYEKIKRGAGNTAAAEIARVLREQYGDEPFPPLEGGGKTSL